MFGFTFRQYAACPFRAHTASSVDEQVPGEARKKVPDNILLFRGQGISGIISPSDASLHAFEGEMIPEKCKKRSAGARGVQISGTGEEGEC